MAHARSIRSPLAIFLLLCASVLSAAPSSAQTAHELVADVTVKLKTQVDQNRHFLSTQPETYYNAVGSVLEPVVDFNFIAMSVMGPYAQQATPEQRERFLAVFKTGLISTYAKGMAGFGDLDIVVLPPTDALNGQRRVNVEQEVRSPDGKINRISYTMGLNKSGQWKLINVVLNGINLGKTFRSQFMQSMKKLGSIDAVINDWANQGSDQATVAAKSK